jgi:hypothetical protein
MIMSRRMRWAGHETQWERRGMHIGYRCQRQGKRPLGRPRCRWVDNIKIDLTEIGWGSMNWIDLAQDRDQWRALLNVVVNLRVP